MEGLSLYTLNKKINDINNSFNQQLIVKEISAEKIKEQGKYLEDKYVLSSNITNVAISGNYNDLNNKPTSLPANGGNADTVDGKHASDLQNYNNLTNKPTALPANGGNADTVDGKHASDLQNYNNLTNKPTNIESANKLNNSRTINGTYFNGTQNIVTNKWGTSRNITIGNSTKSIDGSNNITYTLNEIGISNTSKGLNIYNYGSVSDEIIGNVMAYKQNNYVNLISSIATETSGRISVYHSDYSDNSNNTNMIGGKNINYLQNYNNLINKPTSMKNPYSLTISLNGVTNTSYDGSSSKSINITPSSIGAATSSHTHTKSQITDFPDKLPANGGNADTVDNKHASEFLSINGGTLNNTLYCKNIDGMDTENSVIENFHVIAADLLSGDGSSIYNVDANTVGGKNINELQNYNNLTNKPLSLKNPNSLNIKFSDSSTYLHSYDGNSNVTIGVTQYQFFEDVTELRESTFEGYFRIGSLDGNYETTAYTGISMKVNDNDNAAPEDRIVFDNYIRLVTQRETGFDCEKNCGLTIWTDVRDNDTNYWYHRASNILDERAYNKINNVLNQKANKSDLNNYLNLSTGGIIQNGSTLQIITYGNGDETDNVTISSTSIHLTNIGYFAQEEPQYDVNISPLSIEIKDASLETGDNNCINITANSIQVVNDTNNSSNITGFNTISAGKFNSTGADYAEFIKPWFDNNEINEDRVGYFVTIKNNLLYKAQEGDYIVGVTSGNPSIIGNSNEENYKECQRDEFGRILIEDNKIKEKTQNNKLTNKINKSIITKKILNKNKSSAYKNYIKKDKKKWDCVGIVGVLPIRDDGTCIADGFCKCNNLGIATYTNEYTLNSFRVIERVSPNVVKIIMR